MLLSEALVSTIILYNNVLKGRIHYNGVSLSTSVDRLCHLACVRGAECGVQYAVCGVCVCDYITGE